MNEFTFIDLFSGLGGFRIALENLGGTCLCSSDIDEPVREVYKDNFGDYPLGDITKVPTEQIPIHDFLCAGFPCQPFSIAGKRLGFEDTRGTLFFEVARILKEHQPKLVLLENVAGLKSHDGGKTLATITQTMEELGYDFSSFLVNASTLGIPQNRNRWYGVGFRKDLGLISKFSPPKELLPYKTLAEIIKTNTEHQYQITAVAQKNIETFLPEFEESPRFDGSAVLIANEIRASRCHFRCDGIAPCLTAKMGTGGNNVPVVVSQNRKLTERECLDLMGFPDWYQIRGNTMQSYKQIGNSICVPVVQEIARRMLHTLSEENDS